MSIETSATRPNERTYAIGSWLFVRLLAVAYLFAFWSLASQLPGLIGHAGILPAAEYLGAVRAAMDADGIGAASRLWSFPTVFWLNTSDAFVRGVAIAGAAMSVLVAAGFAPVIFLPLLWVSYLSLSVVCSDFLAYQWDALLLEAGLIAVALAPLTLRHRLRDALDPPWLSRWLFWWLLFRFVFGSGLVKLTSGDPTWRNLTALAYHYETQPLPTVVAWYASQLPVWFHEGTTAAALAIELFLPWLIAAGRRGRQVACAGVIALQAGIGVTGNYAFFNLLTIALALTLLDDRALKRLARRPGLDGKSSRRARAEPAVAWTLAIITVPASLLAFSRQLGLPVGGEGLLAREAALIAPLRSVNSYGLFAVMTTTRPEIVLEGSPDGVNWTAYQFKDKPVDLGGRPRWVAPFQPRVDWQMWFAALSRYQEEPWFQRFEVRLLERSPAVLALMADDPFRDRPARFIRATLYRYRFSDAATRTATGRWWTRELLGPYAPIRSADR